MEDTLLKVLNIPIATSGNPLGEYTHINNIIGPAIGVGGTIYNLLKSTNFHHRGRRRGWQETREEKGKGSAAPVAAMNLLGMHTRTSIQ